MRRHWNEIFDGYWIVAELRAPLLPVKEAGSLQVVEAQAFGLGLVN